MSRKLGYKILVVVLLITLAGNVVYPRFLNTGIDFINSNLGLSLPHFPQIRFRFGLDLQGGSRLIYEADVSSIPKSERGPAVEGARDVIERRVNTYGVSEAEVMTSRVGDSWRIIVKLPNVKDLDQALQWIGETPRLEFKEKRPLPDLTSEQKQEMEQYNQKAKQKAQKILSKATSSNFASLAKQYSEDEATKDRGGNLGWIKKEQLPSRMEKMEKALFEQMKQGELKLVESPGGYHLVQKTASQTIQGIKQVKASHILIKKKTKADFVDLEQWDPWKNTKLGGEELEDARVRIDKTTGEATVVLEFNEKGTGLFAEITKRNLDKPLAIFLDGRSIVDTDGDGKITSKDVYAPIVRSEINNGRAVISKKEGAIPTDRAKKIAERLRAGALPVPIGDPIYQKTIGPTLGKASLQKSLMAGVVGFAAIILFMILVYRLPGLLASISLVTYGAIVLTLFKLIPVTLSIAGIGGAILSVGMAIDANILIFSRFKEELRAKQSFSVSVIEAFRRAWPSIRDGNFTTLIAALILFSFGTSFVKGFALTLGIGILISIFASMFITRTLLNTFEGSRFENNRFLWP